jgi:hypothetical protein
MKSVAVLQLGQGLPAPLLGADVSLSTKQKMFKNNGVGVSLG